MKVKKLFALGIFTTPIIATLALGFSLKAQAAELGKASEYNVFVLENIAQQYTDIEGKLAAGGDVNFFGGIGDRLPANSGNVVVAGRDFNFAGGQVFNGNAVYGRNANVAANTGIPNGTLTKGNPINFQVAGNELKALSQYLASLTPTGTTNIQPGGGINLIGSGQTLNIFNLSGADLSKTNNFEISADPNSTVVVNISGQDVSMQNFGFNIVGTNRTKVLYNFFEATNITANSVGIQGSILAPFADVIFNSGEINGNVIVKSLTGNGESHNNLFQGDLPDITRRKPEKPDTATVPEPGIILGLGLFVGVMSVKNKKEI